MIKDPSRREWKEDYAFKLRFRVQKASGKQISKKKLIQRKKVPDFLHSHNADTVSVYRVQGEDSVAEIFALHFGTALRERQRAPPSLPGGPRVGLSDLRVLVLLCRINSSGFFFNDNSISAPFEVAAYINRICLIFSSCGGGKAKIKEKRAPTNLFLQFIVKTTCFYSHAGLKKGKENHSTQNASRKKTGKPLLPLCVRTSVGNQREEREC